jgi:hypothetical protein
MYLRAPLVIAAVLFSVPASACELVRIFSGETVVATVKNEPDPPYEGYETFLIRNNMRSSDGILIPSIRGELIPARWGFDLQNSGGQRVGLVGSDHSIDDVSDEQICGDVRITYRIDKGAIVFLDRGRPIGKMTGKLARRLLQK